MPRRTHAKHSAHEPQLRLTTARPPTKLPSLAILIGQNGAAMPSTARNTGREPSCVPWTQRVGCAQVEQRRRASCRSAGRSRCYGDGSCTSGHLADGRDGVQGQAPRCCSRQTRRRLTYLPRGQNKSNPDCLATQRRATVLPSNPDSTPNSHPQEFGSIVHLA